MLSDRIAAARLPGRYKFLTVPYCTKHTGTKAPPKACPGPLGRPYKGYIWSRKDPNAAGNKDQCTDIKPQNVCADQKTLCSTAAECRMCKADGSMAVFTSTTGKLFGNLEVQKYVSVDECKANAVLLLAVCLHLFLSFCMLHRCSFLWLVCGQFRRVVGFSRRLRWGSQPNRCGGRQCDPNLRAPACTYASGENHSCSQDWSATKKLNLRESA